MRNNMNSLVPNMMLSAILPSVSMCISLKNMHSVEVSLPGEGISCDWTEC